MKQLSGKEIKEIQLDILKSIHDFCTERSIRYSLAYGALLRAMSKIYIQEGKNNL